MAKGDIMTQIGLIIQTVLEDTGALFNGEAEEVAAQCEQALIRAIGEQFKELAHSSTVSFPLDE
jgi:hypothetical protein